MKLGLFSLTFLILFVLKLCEFIACSWLVVFSPLIAGFVISVIVVSFCLAVIVLSDNNSRGKLGR
jgi:hypothetical protein